MKIEIIGNRRTFIKSAALFGGLAVLLGLAGRPGVPNRKGPCPNRNRPARGIGSRSR